MTFGVISFRRTIDSFVRMRGLSSFVPFGAKVQVLHAVSTLTQRKDLLLFLRHPDLAKAGTRDVSDVVKLMRLSSFVERATFLDWVKASVI